MESRGVARPAGTILVVEDHHATRTFIADNLAADGFEPVEAEGVADAQRLLKARLPDLVLLDLGLADGDGLDLMRLIRDSDAIAGRLDPDIPLVILSGRGTELDRLRGFEKGCDDYLVKPFSYTELRARIQAVLRRSRRRLRQGRVRVGSLEIDPASREVWVAGEPVELSKKEFALLRALASDPTRVFTREELLRGVWGFRSMCPTRTVDSHAHRLRGKINRGKDKFIINVWGVGYRLVDGRAEG
jgi:DNA-binding response OmpR family regulator